MKKIFISICLIAVLASCTMTSVEPDNTQKAEVRYKLALAHMQAENTTLALKELLTAVEYDPENSAIQAALAQAYQKKKAYPQAEQHYLKSIDLSANDPRYQNNLATLYLDMERWEDAVVYFDSAADNLLFVDAHVAAAGKGYAYYKMNDFDAALDAFDEAIDLTSIYAEAHFLKSRIYQKLNDSERVEVELREALDDMPQFLQARYELALLLLEAEQIQDAIIQLELILNLSETSVWGEKAKKTLQDIENL